MRMFIIKNLNSLMCFQVPPPQDMAEAIRKDQQSQGHSIEIDSAQEKNKTSIQGAQTNTRSVGRKHKADSPISQVRIKDKMQEC